MSRMTRFGWVTRQRGFRSRSSSDRDRRLGNEPLESRQMLAAVTVSNALDLVNGNTASIADLIANDGGDGIALREAIQAANNTAGPDNIDFNAALAGSTINLTVGQLAISSALTITGLGASQLTIDAGNGTDNTFGTGDGFQIFDIFDGTVAQLDVTISGLTLTGGDITGFGGAIINSENLILTDAILSGNSASNDGGGIYNENGTANVTSSTIAGNSAGDDGGGINNSNGTVTVTSSTISGNSASDDGGGIFSSSLFGSGTVTVTSSTISGNSASDDGGGIFSSSSTLTVTSSTISGNSASDDGGGIFSNTNLAGLTATITNSTISGNTATTGRGGGIFNTDGLTVIQSSTTTANTAPVGFGSGVASLGNTDTRTEVTGSIIAGNTNEDVAVVTQSSNNSFQSNGFNLIGTGGGILDGLANFNQTGDQTGVANPMLGALANNGGPTLTHAVLIGSPALNLGDPGFAGPPANDQRGAPFARVAGGRIDVGAFESQALALVVDTAVDESDGDFSLGDLSLREALELANANPGADTITFNAALAGSTINLVLGQLSISDAVTITGLGASQLTIDAGNGTDNTFATGDGFRIFEISDGTGTLVDVTISGLTLTGGDTSGVDGGAIINSENLTLTDSVLSGNAASINGGGISNSGILTVTSSMISGNSGGRGGGIYNISGTLNVTGSTISGNSAGVLGGGISNEEGTLNVTSSTISGNSADFGGGGIYSDTDLFGLATTITNSTISGNTVTTVWGGGILNTGGLTVIRSSTITANTAPVSSGSGVASWGITDTRTEVTGSIIAGNTNEDVAVVTQSSNNSFQSNGFNLIGTGGGILDGLANFNQTGDQTGVANPMLGALANNGGPTQTHAVLVGSQALNLGDPGFAGPPANDQRGAPFARVAGGRIDIGAFESQSLALVVDTAVDESDGDFSLGDLSLREALELANANPGADTITFNAALAGSTINLVLGQLSISDAVTITGLGASQLTIDAGNGTDNTFATGDGFRIFEISDGTGTLVDVNLGGLTLTGGDVTGFGGAISNSENLILTDSILSGNSATAVGGGIQTFNGPVNVTNSTISGNSAGVEGGGIFTFSSLNVTDSTISGNSASRGGGILSNTDLFGITTTITNSTISGNTATTDQGGGIFNIDGLTVIRSSTITANTAPVGVGSGVASFANSNTRTEVTNSIIAGNTNEDVALVNVSSNNSFQSNGFNLIGTGGGLLDPLTNFTQTGDQVGVANPMLGALANNGGPTQTHAVLIGSPALDMGDPGFAGPPANDQRGAPFVRVAGGRIDIGAFEAQPLVVDTAVDESDGDFSLGDLSLREALELANINPGADTITFDASLSGATISLIQSLGQLNISSAVTITGLGASQLTIDAGNGTDNTFATGDGFRILNIDDGTATLLDVNISGLTLTGGDVSLGDLSGRGGAIRNSENLMLTGSTISGNSAGDDGGGIYSLNGAVEVTSTTISGNAAGNTSLGDGGGISSFIGTLNVTSSTISGNSAGNDGGGIYSENGIATITSSTISGNSTGDDGGGISSFIGTLNVTGTTISGNSAGDDGGGIESLDGTLNVTSSTISGNTAFEDGGGIDSDTDLTGLQTTTVTNSTISGNTTTTGRGGGIFNVDGLTVIRSSTITANTAPVGLGSGVWSFGDNDTVTTVTPSIVSGNINEDVEFGDGAINSFTSGNFNLIGTGNATAAFSLSGDQTGVTNPMLGALANNGGPTQTHAVLIGSQALNLGDPGFAGPLTNDQRGAPFVRVAGGRIDIGAFEAQSLLDTIGVFDPNGNAIFANPGGVYLRNALVPGPPDVGPFSVTGSLSAWIPIAGDWNFDGVDSIGVYDPATATFRLRNTNSDGAADTTFVFGSVSGLPIAGDWDNDGTDTVGVYDSSTGTFSLRNEEGGTTQFVYQPTGWQNSWLPIAGDWNGNGTDTIGLFDPDSDDGTSTFGNGEFYLRNANSAGPNDIAAFAFGAEGSQPLVGDWNGNGTDTIGVYDPQLSIFNLRNTNDGGQPDAAVIGFGGAQLALPSGSLAWIAIAGDWNGPDSPPPPPAPTLPGTTVGVFDPTGNAIFPTPGGTYLRNSLFPGPADVGPFAISGTGSNWLPIAGDWDNNNTDTVGGYDPATATFNLRNDNSSGAPDVTFAFGSPNLLPIAGDWDNDGTDTVGVYNPATGTFSLRNEEGGTTQFVYQPAGWQTTWLPVAGDWNGDGTDTIGLFDPDNDDGTTAMGNGEFYLRNSNSTGINDIPAFSFGAEGSQPLVGDWNGNSTDTIGVYDAQLSIFNLRNSNDAGSPDAAVIGFGSAQLALPPGSQAWIAIAGNWNGSGSPLRAANVADANSATAAPIDESQLEPLVAEAISQWTLILPRAVELVADVQVQLADLPNDLLGLTDGQTIRIDRDAAGNGWFVDESPADDTEFIDDIATDVLQATNNEAATRVDLLTVLTHEIGHVFGLGDLAGDDNLNDVMAEFLPEGIRREPSTENSNRIQQLQ